LNQSLSVKIARALNRNPPEALYKGFKWLIRGQSENIAWRQVIRGGPFEK
jgi:hypothetical protein